MQSILIVSALLKLGYAAAALLLMWWMLRLLTWSTGRDMRAVLDRIDSEQRAAALYYGARLLAVALLIGFAIS